MKLVLKNKTTLEDLPPGSLFMTLNMQCLGMKSEYHTDKGAVEAYIVGSGEFFWGGTGGDVAEQRKLEVIRVKVKGRKKQAGDKENTVS
ncbi:MAG: hypothetical protein WC333_00050 [Dehalococcoidia bacterium]|jgi:hypothetical protein